MVALSHSYLSFYLRIPLQLTSMFRLILKSQISQPYINFKISKLFYHIFRSKAPHITAFLLLHMSSGPRIADYVCYRDQTSSPSAPASTPFHQLQAPAQPQLSQRLFLSLFVSFLSAPFASPFVAPFTSLIVSILGPSSTIPFDLHGC
jgi:hypothetical protein